MSDDRISGVPFEPEDPSEQKLWQALGDLPQETPSRRLREAFHAELDRAALPGFATRLRQWFGFSNNLGWASAAAALVVGIGLGQFAGGDRSDANALDALEQQVATLNRSLILDRLESASAGKRLRGVLDAVTVAEQDAEVARALLARATEDPVLSVRSAAIDALGPQLAQPALGDELMLLLEAAESPLVQLALVDMVLRYGSADQLERLLALAESGRLHPDLIQHVNTAVRKTRA